MANRHAAEVMAGCFLNLRGPKFRLLLQESSRVANGLELPDDFIGRLEDALSVQQTVARSNTFTSMISLD